MSKISYLLRGINKDGASPVSIKHTHLGSDFVRATGESVPAKLFNMKTGKVKGTTDAPDVNAKIERVRADVETAAHNAVLAGLEPNKANVGAHYDALLAERQEAEEWDVVLKTAILPGSVARLKAELAKVELRAEELRGLIAVREGIIGLPTGKLFTDYVDRLMDERATLITPNTMTQYRNLRMNVAAFNPLLRLDAVTLATMNEFRDFLVGKGLRNLTVRSVLMKFKAVVNYFADEVGVDTKPLLKFENVSQKKSQNIIYLSEAQVNELAALPLTGKDELVRDQFLLMCYVGVRFSDLFFTRADVEDGVLNLTTQKTDTEISVPLVPQAVALLEKYDYAVPRVTISEMNFKIKRICKSVPSFAKTEKVTTYNGINKEKEYLPKYDLISAHAGRKTFINRCLAKGVNPAVIAGWVGHKNLKMISVYANKQQNHRAEMDKVAAPVAGATA